MSLILIAWHQFSSVSKGESSSAAYSSAASWFKLALRPFISLLVPWRRSVSYTVCFNGDGLKAAWSSLISSLENSKSESRFPVLTCFKLCTKVCLINLPTKHRCLFVWLLCEKWAFMQDIKNMSILVPWLKPLVNYVWFYFSSLQQKGQLKCCYLLWF